MLSFGENERFQEFPKEKSLRESDDDDRNLAHIKKLQILV
jgi:hypothetical protein